MYVNMRTSRNKKKAEQQPRKFKKYMQGKLAFCFVLITLALFALGVVVATIGYKDNEEYAKIVLSQQDYDSRVITAQRGSIVDRNGTILATNEPVFNLILDPKVILANEGRYKEMTIDALVTCFGYDKATITALIESKSESSYLRYEKGMSADLKEQFELLQEEWNAEAKKNDELRRVKGVWFETEYKRIYPYDSLASSVIGFSGSDSSRGNYGLEQFYNENLAGTNGREYGFLSDGSNLERVVKDAVDGDTLVTTIDANIQRIVEEKIAKFMNEVGAKTTAVIIMNPNNGEVLAMANNRTFNLNQPGDLSAYYTDADYDATNVANLLEYYTQEQIDAMTEEQRTLNLKAARQDDIWRNYCISEVVEPGSTAKIFTVAAGLEEAIISKNSSYYCDGGEEFSGIGVACHLKRGHEMLSLKEALMESCNDALMQIGLKIGAKTFDKYQDLFNFGMKTGIDLSGEERGLVWEPDQVTDLTLATESFGQNYNVTMVQLAAAFSSVINGGYYYEPHMVRQILGADGNVKETIDKTLVRRTVSNSTCEFIKDALLATVDRGTGEAAAIPGYAFAGKTGTAQKYPREAEHYLISFAGFLPYDDPEILIYVVIDEPNVEKQDEGGFGTALTKEIMEALIPYLNLHPTREIPEEEKPQVEDAVVEEPDVQEPEEPEEPQAEEPIVDDDRVYTNGNDNQIYENLQQQGSRVPEGID